MEEDGLQNAVPRQLAELTKMTRRQLQQRWLTLFPVAPHRKLSRSLMVSILGYRLQEEAYGPLSAEVQARLRAIDGETSPRRPLGSRRSAPSLSPPDREVQKLRRKKPPTPVRLSPGTRLLREWRGQTYVILVVEHGFEFHGGLHKSLSEIARLITGTRWSGPLFFGLKPRVIEAVEPKLGARYA